MRTGEGGIEYRPWTNTSRNKKKRKLMGGIIKKRRDVK